MHLPTQLKSVVTTAVALGALCAGTGLAEAATYLQTDLVSDIPGLAAITDPNLTNPWGVSHLTGSPFWISDQGTNVTTLYAVTGSTSVSPVSCRQHPDNRKRAPRPHRAGLQLQRVGLHANGWLTRSVHLRQSQRHHIRLESGQRHGSYNRMEHTGRPLHRARHQPG